MNAVVEENEAQAVTPKTSTTSVQENVQTDSVNNEKESCFKACVKFKSIGSMKDYWRTKIDVVRFKTSTERGDLSDNGMS